VFDERKGEVARYHVDDPRIRASVAAYLKDPKNAVQFFGHSVPLDTPGRVVGRLTNNTGWLRQGRADDALIIETNDWDTHTITSFVAAILLKERVGYNVAFIQTAGAGGTFGRMAPREAHMPVHANVEVWPNSKLAQIAKWSAATTNAGALGAVGRDGLYMTSKLRDEEAKGGVFPEYWRFLSRDSVAEKTSYSPSPIFNASLLGGCFTGAGGGAAGAEACTTCKEGTKWNCVNGTFVTPACEANGGPASGKCGVITMMDPAYSPGFVQQVTSNLNLSFQLSFVGYSAALRHVLEREKHGEPVLFYGWEPDLFHAQNPGKFVRIVLPPPNPECMKRSTSDPTGGVDCDFPLDPLTKFHSANLAAIAGKVATRFFREMTVSSAMHEEMLGGYSKIGADDGTDHFQAACAWLKANEVVWAPWVDKATSAGTRTAGGSTNQLSAPAIAAFVTLLVVAAAVFVLSHKKYTRLRALLQGDGPERQGRHRRNSRLTPDQKLKRKLAERQVRAVLSTLLETMDVLTDIMAWATLAIQHQRCRNGSTASVCLGVAGSEQLVALLSVLTALAFTVSCYTLRARLNLYRRAHTYYTQGFPSLHLSGDVAASASSGASMNKDSSQAKYEMLRMRIKSLRLTWLSLATENVPMALYYGRLVLLDDAGTTINVALWFTLVSMGFKFKSGIEIQHIRRKLKKHRHSLEDGGARLALGSTGELQTSGLKKVAPRLVPRASKSFENPKVVV